LVFLLYSFYAARVYLFVEISFFILC